MEYVNALNRIVQKENVDLVIPNTYDEVDALAGAGVYAPFACFLPDPYSIRRCQDKWRFWHWLKENSLGNYLPRSAKVVSLLEVPEIIERITGDSEHGKVWIRARKGAGAFAAAPVCGTSEAFFWIRYWENHRGLNTQDFMFSEYLPGRDIIVSMVWRHGQLVWLRSFEKCGYFEGKCRPSGTSSTGIVDKAFFDAKLFEDCRYIISTLNPHAHGNWTLDWKQDITGQWKITECNIGRFIQGTLLFNRIPEQRDWLDAYLKAYSGWDFMDEPVWYDNTGWFTVRSVNRGLYLGKEEGLADLKRIAETD